MKAKRDYSDRFTAEFNKNIDGNEEIFGASYPTAPEIGALRKILRKLDFEGLDKKERREAVIKYIVENGLPEFENVTPEEVARAALFHACGVARFLTEKRGEEGASSTFQSYTTKSSFDRFVGKVLPKDVREDWNRPIERDSEKKEYISYPGNLSEKFIYGAGLPHRFLASQTIRNLELVRLGRADEALRSKLGIKEDTDLKKYAVPWEFFISEIKEAGSLKDLTQGIVKVLVKQLLVNGLSAEQIRLVINGGYSEKGMIWEHGRRKQIFDVVKIANEQMEKTLETAK